MLSVSLWWALHFVWDCVRVRVGGGAERAHVRGEIDGARCALHTIAHTNSPPDAFVLTNKFPAIFAWYMLVLLCDHVCGCVCVRPQRIVRSAYWRPVHSLLGRHAIEMRRNCQINYLQVPVLIWLQLYEFNKAQGCELGGHGCVGLVTHMLMYCMYSNGRRICRGDLYGDNVGNVG